MPVVIARPIMIELQAWPVTALRPRARSIHNSPLDILPIIQLLAALATKNSERDAGDDEVYAYDDLAREVVAKR